MKYSSNRAVPIAMGLLAWAATARSSELIVNGGFESGLAGWTLLDQLGSDGTFAVQSGTLSPVNGNVVPPPPQGIFAAMSDAQGPGTHVLYQDIFIPAAVGSATLSFSLYLGNSAQDFFVPSPPTLDFSTPLLNQQVRVDIQTTVADTLSASDVLLNVYQSNPGDPLVSGYNPVNLSLTSLFQAHAGETLRLRFAQADNVFILNAGVDNVSVLVIAIPEVPPLIPGALALVGALWWSRRARRAEAQQR